MYSVPCRLPDGTLGPTRPGAWPCAPRDSGAPACSHTDTPSRPPHLGPSALAAHAPRTPLTCALPLFAYIAIGMGGVMHCTLIVPESHSHIWCSVSVRAAVAHVPQQKGSATGTNGAGTPQERAVPKPHRRQATWAPQASIPTSMALTQPLTHGSNRACVEMPLLANHTACPGPLQRSFGKPCAWELVKALLASRLHIRRLREASRLTGAESLQGRLTI